MIYDSIQVEDLLGRPPITISAEFVCAIREDLENSSILITGAAGSIGSEIVRQVAHFNPSILLLCDIAETPLYELELEMRETFPEVCVVSIICDVKDVFRTEKIFRKYKPMYVYHAAAYKHVPMMEAHPSEAVLTNVFGTKNVVDLAVRYNARAFVMISTDKAVNPTNIMGASKRIAEMYVQSLFRSALLDSLLCTRIITTRFGNVMSSNGSVIPRFKEQIAKGGPVTVTHPDVIRYFMTIPEACRLVLEAACMGTGGEIFVFDMGKPVKILDLAKKMISMEGYVPDKDIEVVFTGLRPGEKLYEELLSEGEKMTPTSHKIIKIAGACPYDYGRITAELAVLHKYAKKMQDYSLIKKMKQIVPEFTTSRRSTSGR